MENTYRMTDRDIKLLIQLRATNADIFTGRKNSAMRGWRAIRNEMGIQGALSAQQLKKKWDNLKDKYRVLKNPPLGMETPTSSWRWFHLMDEAMCGRLAGTASVVQPSTLSEDEDNVSSAAAVPSLLLPKTEASFSGLESGALRDVLELSGIEAESRTGSPAEVVSAGRIPECEPAANKSQTGAVLYATLLPGCTFESVGTPAPSSSSPLPLQLRQPPVGLAAAGPGGEPDRRLEELQREWRALEREQAEFDRELIALERDRDTLSRDTAALERDRELLDRERAVLDRDRVVLDRDRAFLDRDRAFLDRDRVFLERAREDLERERALLRRESEEEPAVDGRQAQRSTEKEVVLQTRFYQRLMAADLDPDQLETRQRLLCLFQRLVEKL
ncbi:rootletin-like [Cebidichthys violaceus]|uniref:rootletin-like n=1 Tax=Cebidichthys violaceus TaxID=271503 RepID=UPI0035CC9209